jgi:hypothetical protein
MQQSGVNNIFLLPQSEIGMNIDSQVDGIHASDLGMYKYAQAYSKYIKVILGLNN